ncbi:MAG: type VI secretion system tip protein TssI/VgrG [Polyangiaceae bacterium]
MSEELVLVYWMDLGGTAHPTRKVVGTEGLSKPYRFEVTFAVAPDSPFDPNELVRSTAYLRLERSDGGTERVVKGLVSEVKRKATRHGNAGAGDVTVVLEPTLSLLRHRQDIRLFRDKTGPQIAAEVMRGLGVQVEERLAETYKIRPYTVQFRESDLDFAHRLLEDEGVYYFINEQDVVVFGDTPGGYDGSVGLLPFKHDSGLSPSQNPIVQIGSRGTMTAGKVTLRDFNPVHPRLNMDVSAKGPTQGGAEYYDYPGEYEEPGEGQRKANLRAEALRCAHHRVAGRSHSAMLRPGTRFETLGTPAGIHDGEFVVTHIVHDWTKDERGYAINFESLPSAVTFRPPVVTPAPSQPNPLTGFVTGPPGADIHTNEWGQVKVHFPWDRLFPKDDTCSWWIPVLQDNTGHSSSMSRTNWEVLCAFMEGDLDRPVVLGRVYNADDPHASPLPERKMRTALRSITSPRTEGEDSPSNFINLDDEAGLQLFTIHATKDQNVVVKNNKSEQIDNTESLDIRGNETISVGANQITHTATNLMPTVTGNQARTIGGGHDLKVGSSMSESVAGNSTVTIGGSHIRNFGMRDNLSVAKNTKETIGAVDLEISLKTNMDQAEKTRTLLVGGAVIEVAKNNKVEQSGLGRLETIGGVAFAKADATMHSRVEKIRKTNVGGMLKIDAVKELLIAGLEKLTKKALSASYTGTEKLTFKVGSTEINMKEGRIELSSTETITVKTTGQNKQGSKTSSQI